MNLRNPAVNVNLALEDAVNHRLLAIADGFGGHRRPDPLACEVIMFGQTWLAADMGMRKLGGADAVEGETIVITGPMNDACVYFSGRLAYHLRQPNRRFFLDVAAQLMAPDGKRYEGRDDAEVESVPYGIEMEISRLHAALRTGERTLAGNIGRLLHSYGDRFEKIAA